MGQKTLILFISVLLNTAHAYGLKSESAAKAQNLKLSIKRLPQSVDETNFDKIDLGQSTGQLQDFDGQFNDDLDAKSALRYLEDNALNIDDLIDDEAENEETELKEASKEKSVYQDEPLALPQRELFIPEDKAIDFGRQRLEEREREEIKIHKKLKEENQFRVYKKKNFPPIKNDDLQENKELTLKPIRLSSVQSKKTIKANKKSLNNVKHGHAPSIKGQTDSSENVSLKKLYYKSRFKGPISGSAPLIIN